MPGTLPYFCAKLKFTGYERDDETKLDYAQARYYNGTQGRFASADPLLESGIPPNPKTWNRYVYALNNPLRYVDPTGLISCPPGKTCVSENTPDEHYFDPELDDYIHSGSGGMADSGLAPVAGLVGPIAPVAVNAATTASCTAALPVVAGVGAVFNLYLLGERIMMDQIPYSPYGMTLPDGTRSISCTAGNQALQQLQRVDSGSVFSEERNRRREQYFVRFGPGPESAEQLTKSADDTVGNPNYPYGVSVFLKERISGTDRMHRSATVSEARSAFEIVQTGKRPNHYTVILPNPVTPEAAARFNSIFRPK